MQPFLESSVPARFWRAQQVTYTPHGRTRWARDGRAAGASGPRTAFALTDLPMRSALAPAHTAAVPAHSRTTESPPLPRLPRQRVLPSPPSRAGTFRAPLTRQRAVSIPPALSGSPRPSGCVTAPAAKHSQAYPARSSAQMPPEERASAAASWRPGASARLPRDTNGRMSFATRSNSFREAPYLRSIVDRSPLVRLPHFR